MHDVWNVACSGAKGGMDDIENRGLADDASQRLIRLREDIRAASLMGNSVLAAKLTMAYVNTATDPHEPGATSSEDRLG